MLKLLGLDLGTTIIDLTREGTHFVQRNPLQAVLTPERPEEMSRLLFTTPDTIGQVLADPWS